MKNASAKMTGATTLRAPKGRENTCSGLAFVDIAYLRANEPSTTGPLQQRNRAVEQQPHDAKHENGRENRECVHPRPG